MVIDYRDFTTTDMTSSRKSNLILQSQSNLRSAADAVDNADKKNYSTLPTTPPITCTTFHSKNAHSRCLRIKGHGRLQPMTKTGRYKNSFLIRCLYHYA